MRNMDENKDLREALSGLTDDVPPMPEGLHAAWMQKVTEDPYKQPHMEKPQLWRGVTRFLSVAAAMVFIIGGTLLTRDTLLADSMDMKFGQNESGYTRTTSAKESYDYGAEAYDYGAEAYDYEEDSAMNTGVMLTAARGASADAAAAENTAAVTTEKKIIRTASLTIQTQTFEDSLNALKAACEEQGGWLEYASEDLNSYTGLRTAYLTLRIPQDGLDVYLDETAALGRVTSRSESATDVTASYQDTQTRLDTQLALMERLKALINESGDLSDLLALESQIADTQYQIDALQSSLNRTDRQVTYSTVSVTLREEKAVELTDSTVSFGKRILSAITVGFDALVEFLQDMVVFLVAALPFIIIVAVMVIIIRIIRKRRK